MKAPRVLRGPGGSPAALVVCVALLTSTTAQNLLAAGGALTVGALIYALSPAKAAHDQSD